MDKKLVVKRIDELIAENRISLYKLKENAEISSTIYQWRINPKRDATRNPSLKSIEKICEYFGISLYYFFAFDKEEQFNAKQRMLAGFTKNLSPAEMDALIRMAELLAEKRVSVNGDS